MPPKERTLSSRFKSFFGHGSARKRAGENAESQARLGREAPETSAIPVSTQQIPVDEEVPVLLGSLATGGEQSATGLQNDKPQAVITSLSPTPNSERYPRNLSDVSSKMPVPTPLTESYNILSGASNFHLEHLHFINAPSRGSNLDLASSEGWKLLLQHTAPNALYNSSARFDPPKCDEDTRVKILEEIMTWIRDRKGTTRLLCLTGAAGAGKSALQQTIAERCSSERILASSFFFSANDHTRDNVSKLVPTVAYQIAQKDVQFRRLLVEAVESDPLIFEKSLKTQFDTLIAGPWKVLQAGGGEDLQVFPQGLLIDGLDECLDMRRQEELLVAINDCFLSSPDLPFRIFLASRPELAIRTALDPSGDLHNRSYHIRLSDEHNATADIRRMLWRRLKDIGSRCNDPRAHPDLWPTKEDIETLVKAASGQFIYAATVVKYVGEVRSSPVERLRVVLTWTPGQRGRPFAPLDLLYCNIVSAAKAAYEAVDINEYDFLILLKIFDRECDKGKLLDITVDTVQEALGLPEGIYRSLFSDLRALIRQPNPRDPRIFKYYHISFSEWFNHEERCGSLFVPSLAADEFAVSRILTRIRQCQQIPGNSPQAARCAAFLMSMVCWSEVEDVEQASLAHPGFDLFLDFASESGALKRFVESTLVYYTSAEIPSLTVMRLFIKFEMFMETAILALKDRKLEPDTVRYPGLEDALLNAQEAFSVILTEDQARGVARAERSRTSQSSSTLADRQYPEQIQLLLDGLELDHAPSCLSRVSAPSIVTMYEVEPCLLGGTGRLIAQRPGDIDIFHFGMYQEAGEGDGRKAL